MFNQPNLTGLKPQDPGPNPFDSHTEELKKAVDSAKEALVLIRDNPKLDHVASGLALYLLLKNSGKSVTIACPTEMRVEFNRLVGVNKITSKIGNRNLVISFPYVKDSIEKVSYNVDESYFNLVIQPKPGFPALDSGKVQYSYSGAEADVVLVIGAQKLDDLGLLYQSERQLFEQATVVNLDASFTNTKFGHINLVWSEFSSLAEIVTELAQRLGLSLDQDIATNLLAGLNDATQNFQRFNLKPTAFAAAAKLMQSGGKRPLTSPAFGPSPYPGGFASPFGSLPRPQSSTPFGSPLGVAEGGFEPRFTQTQSSPGIGFTPNQSAAGAGFTPLTQSQPTAAVVAPSQPPPAPVSQPTPSPTQPTPTFQPQTPTATPLSFSEPPLQPQSNPQAPEDKPGGSDVNDDWLKPKIYKGSTKI